MVFWAATKRPGSKPVGLRKVRVPGRAKLTYGNLHIDAYHRGNYEAQTNFWAQNGSNIDIRDYMNYDPYLGRITENSAAQQ